MIAATHMAREIGEVPDVAARLIASGRWLRDGALAQAGVEADSLTLDDPGEDGQMHAEKFVLNVRPDERAAGDMQLSLHMQGLQLAQPVRSFEGLGQRVENLMIAAVVEESAALAAGAGGDALAPWRAAGGRVRFEGLMLKWGALDAAGVGHIALDDKRRLAGELNLPIKEPAAFFQALAASPEMDSSARQVLMLLSASFTQSAEGLTLDLEGRDGVLLLEGLRVRSLPAVYDVQHPD